jgi:L-lactate dehydrogenase complex protein LldE
MSKKVQIDFFVPCFVDQCFPQSAMNAVRVLEFYGCEVHYHQNQTCCGQPAFNAGFWPEAQEVAEKFIGEYNNDRYVVVLSSSCTGMIKNYYADLFQNSSLQNAWKQIKKNTFEFADFLVKVLKVDTSNMRFDASITYHDACSALRECNIYEEPRKLLQPIQGIEWKEMEKNRTCCGFGGTFAAKYEPISVGMGDHKCIEAEKTGAEFLVSADLSCLLHLKAYLEKKNSSMKVMHLADILVEGIR